MAYVYVCRTCNSSNILSDAYAEFDVLEQKMVLQNTFDDEFCQQCDGPTKSQIINFPDLFIKVNGKCERAIPDKYQEPWLWSKAREKSDNGALYSDSQFLLKANH